MNDVGELGYVSYSYVRSCFIRLSVYYICVSCRVSFRADQSEERSGGIHVTALIESRRKYFIQFVRRFAYTHIYLDDYNRNFIIAEI